VISFMIRIQKLAKNSLFEWKFHNCGYELKVCLYFWVKVNCTFIYSTSSNYKFL